MRFSVDWTQPWYSSVINAATHCYTSNWINALNQQAFTASLQNHRGIALSFVNQTELPEGVAYEAFISSTGKIPTRDNAHDFFNALVWLSFPNIKRELNAIQAKHIAQHGINHIRGGIRDAATVFDENCALLVISDHSLGKQLARALQHHEWISLFIDQRIPFIEHTEVFIFGHALMEKLLNPYKSITAHTKIIMAPDHYFSQSKPDRIKWLDLEIAKQLSAEQPQLLDMSWFTPLPILGIPEWWPAQNFNFYADAQVFRPYKARHKALCTA